MRIGYWSSDLSSSDLDHRTDRRRRARCGGRHASRLVKPGDEVTLGKKAQEMALVAEAQSLPERDLPEYLAIDGTKSTFVRVPTLDEVPYPVKMEPNLVVEFYSR